LVVKIDRAVHGDAPAPARLQGRALPLARRKAAAAAWLGCPAQANRTASLPAREFKSLSPLAMNAFCAAAARVRGMAPGLGDSSPWFGRSQNREHVTLPGAGAFNVCCAHA
jgi:hypothetical protein